MTALNAVIYFVADAAVVAKSSSGALPQGEAVAFYTAVFRVAMAASFAYLGKSASLKRWFAALDTTVGFCADAAMVAEHRKSSRHRFSRIDYRLSCC